MDKICHEEIKAETESERVMLKYGIHVPNTMMTHQLLHKHMVEYCGKLDDIGEEGEMKSQKSGIENPK